MTGSKIIGEYSCPVCGKACPVKQSARGRLSVVCKWQDDGCGSQLQTLTADASMQLRRKIKQVAEDQAPEIAPEVRQQEQAAARPVRAPSPAESWGLI